MRKSLLFLIPFILLSVSPAWSAISCGDATEANDAAPAGTTATINYTTPAGSDLVLFLGFAMRDATDTISSATHAGNAMTAVAAEASGPPIHTRIFYIINPTSGSNNVVATSSGTPLAWAAVVWTCSGVNTAAPVHDATNANGVSATASVTVPNLVAGDVVVDIMGQDIPAGDPTVGADQTTLHLGNDAVEIAWGASYQAAAAGGVMSWGLADSDDWAIQGVALTPAARRAAVPPILLGN